MEPRVGKRGDELALEAAVDSSEESTRDVD
jgi:hypothetical protein